MKVTLLSIITDPVVVCCLLYFVYFVLLVQSITDRLADPNAFNFGEQESIIRLELWLW